MSLPKLKFHPLGSASIFANLIILFLVNPFVSNAANPSHADIEYAQVGDQRLRLDLYLPDTADDRRPPLVVWIHGGAWRAGSKDQMPLGPLLNDGFAIASVGYRLTPVAPFPAQVHDIKAAIRFLRARATDYGYDADRLAIAGASAGGHLAALVGLSGAESGLEGEVGDHQDQSSAVRAIVDFYGPTNFMTILEQSTPHGLGVRIPALQLLLGDQPEDVPDRARRASPVSHVNGTSPPLLLIHGDQDPQVPINQSHELHGQYKHVGMSERVQFEVIHGGAHGGKAFYDEARIGLVATFLQEAFASTGK